MTGKREGGAARHPAGVPSGLPLAYIFEWSFLQAYVIVRGRDR